MYRGERVKSDVRVITPERLERMSRENVEYWLLHEMHRKAQDVDASLIRQALEVLSPSLSQATYSGYHTQFALSRTFSSFSNFFQVLSASDLAGKNGQP